MPISWTVATASEVRVYVDSSALIKRSVQEAESDQLEDALERYVRTASPLVSSSLAWVEVSRALRTRAAHGDANAAFQDAVAVALSGVAERPITEDVVGLARRIGPSPLRTLDAIHLATAILLDVDVLITYDDRLADACRHHGLVVGAPGR